MEKIIGILDQCSLKKSLIYIFSFIAAIVILLGVVTVMGLSMVQKNILDNRKVIVQVSEGDISTFDSEYVISNDDIKTKVLPLSTEQNIVYYGSMVLMIIAPLLFTLVGAYIGSIFYYNLKIKEPVLLLKTGANLLAADDLDFSFSYKKDDEMGELCNSFEIMRKELRKNQYRVNKLSEDRRILIASVAHDIRSPLMIIKGYLSLLTKKYGNNQEILHIVTNTTLAVERLESYVESIRNIQNFDELEVQYKVNSVDNVIHEMKSNFNQLLENTHIELILLNKCNNGYIVTDLQLLLRIMENLISNSKRYAKTKIVITIKTEEQLELYVEDDGPGFPEEILHNAVRVLPKTSRTSEWGMGLYISKILVEKMSGNFQITNSFSGGALIKMTFPQKEIIKS